MTARPLSEITSPILAELYRRESEIFDRANSDLRRAVDRNNETIRDLKEREKTKGKSNV